MAYDPACKSLVQSRVSGEFLLVFYIARNFSQWGELLISGFVFT